MTEAPLDARGLGKRFRREWGLRDCTLTIPEGAVVGLTGPNSAGKSTLLALAGGLLAPTEGTIAVLGRDPLREPAVLAEIGFVAQGAPLYRSFTVAETIELGRRTNAHWDGNLVAEVLRRVETTTRHGAPSAGDRALVALALGKRPQLLLLDEPFAGLDPLAGREFLKLLMDGVAETAATVVIASHVIADIERVCDHIVLLTGGGVRLAGNVEELLDSHRILMGPRRPLGTIRGVSEIVRERYGGRQLTLLVRSRGPILDPSWTVEQVGLEELLLAYMAPERLPTPQPAEKVALRWHG